MIRLLVTGADGQLGSEIHALSSTYENFAFTFISIDDLDFTKADEVERYFSTNSFDYILNCAAYTAVDKAEEELELAELINAKAVEVMARSCQSHGTRFIHVSTDYVYDGMNYKPYEEGDAEKPASVYGMTKLKGEQWLFNVNPESMVVRTSWLYSTHGNNFVKTMLRLGQERSELRVVQDQVGTPTYAADLAKALLDIIEKVVDDQCPFVPGVYHYSNEGVASWYDFACQIFRLKGISCQVEPVSSKEFPTAAPRPHYSVMSKEKIKTNYELSIPHWVSSLQTCLSRMEEE
jgi:dTDP-4-dehydrorhamnose reductase